MPRRNFIQVLREGRIDIKNEYSKLYSMFYERDTRDNKSLAEIISFNFTNFPFSGTCLTLEEFDEMHDIHFEEQPQNFDLDYLVNFCEYIYNFVLYFNDGYFLHTFNRQDYLDHINRVIEAIGYNMFNEEGFVIFVPKDNVAISVSELEIIPNDISYKIIEYNHHSMKNDLERKHHTLVVLSNLLEPKRKELKDINKEIESDIFYAFNNLNIRHNNIDSTGTKYKKFVAEMDKVQLEEWYDEIFQMCLLAFMILDNKKRKEAFDLLKKKIETEK